MKENELIYSRELLESVLDNTASSIMLLKPIRDAELAIVDFEYLYANSQTLKSVDREKLIGKYFTQEFPDVKNSSLFNAYVQVLDTGISYQQEVDIAPYGTPVWAQVYARKTGDNLLVTYFDITEQKKAEQEIKEQAHLLHSVTQNVPAIISLTTYPSGEVEFNNGTLLAALGFDKDEVAKMSLEERAKIFHPDYVEKIKNYYARFDSLMDGEENVAENSIQNKRGEWMWFEVRGRVFKRDENGKVTQVLHITQDISARKKAEQEIREQAYFIRAITDTAPAIISITTYPQGETVFNNRDPYIALGFNAEELCDMTREDRLKLAHPEDVQKLKDYYTQFTNLTDKEEVRIEYRLKSKSGEWVWLDTRGKIFKRDAEGNVTQLLHVAQNITEQKKVEQELKENRELLQSALDASLFGLVYVTAVRDKNGNVIDLEYQMANKFAIDYLGKDIVGKHFLQLYPDHKEKGRLEQLVHVIETGKTQDIERHYEGDGYSNWYRNIAVKLNDGLIISFEDITERKKIEQEILRLKDEVTQKAEDKYHSLFENIDEGVAILELIRDEHGQIFDFIYKEVNEAFSRHVGRNADFAGKKRSEIGSKTEPYFIAALQNVIDTGKSFRGESFSADFNRWITFQYSPVGKKGRAFVAAVFTDITERKLHELQKEFLLKLSDTLRTLVSATEIEYTACSMLGKHLNVGRVNYTIINEKEGYVKIERQYVRDDAPEMTGIFPIASFNWLLSFFRQNKAVVINNIYESDFIPKDDFAAMEKVKKLSLISVPLLKSGEFVCALTVSEIKARIWEQEEIELVRETLERTWEAMERAKAEIALYQSQQRLFKELEDTKRLQQISNRIIEENNIQSLYDAILDSAMELMNADFASIQTLMPETNQLYLLAQKGFHPGSANYWRYVEAGPTSSCGMALATGKRVIVQDMDHPSFDMEKGDYISYRLSGISSVQSTPLISRAGNHIGMMSTHWREPHYPIEREFNLFDVLARQTADLIERKTAEEALRKSEAHLAATFDLLPVGISVVDFTGKTILFNDAMKRFLPEGKIPSQDKNTAHRWQAYDREGKVIKPDNYPTARALRGETVVPGIEFLFRADDGEEKWMLVSALPVRDKSEKVVEAMSLVIDISELKRAEEALRELNENLEKKVQARTRQLNKLSIAQEKERLNAILLGQEMERTRIGEGLHNGVAQLLFAAQSKLQVISPATKKEKQVFLSALSILEDAIRDTRNISFELTPPVLKDYGLQPAIEKFIGKIFGPDVQIRLSFNLKKRLSESLEISIYRISQEILANIRKHSRATVALVEVSETSKNIILRSKDNGSGFIIEDVMKRQAGMGLQNIENRVTLLKGTMNIESQPGHGTLIEIQLPISGKKMKEADNVV